LIDLHILYSELAINPPVISFSSLRNFNWGPVTVPVQTDSRAQSQRTNWDFTYLETAVWFLFDDVPSGLIAQYDITFRRLAWVIDYVKPFIKPQLVEELGSLADNRDDVDDLMHLRAAVDVCQEHELHCLGANQQYESTEACIDYIYRKIPFGKAYEWGGDTGKPFFPHTGDVQRSRNSCSRTAACRYVHKGNTRQRPSVFSRSVLMFPQECSDIAQMSTVRILGMQSPTRSSSILTFKTVPQEVECASSVTYVFFSRL
jgi:hypothetical protein